MAKALALISGSLDSEVAAKLMKQAGIDLTCAEFACPFQHRTNVKETAARLDAPLLALEPDSTFLDVVRRPRFNFGGGPLSCLECRLRMLTTANERRVAIGADIVVTGEVLGQRATNQSRRQIDLITYHSGAEDHLLRPLSAKLLGEPATASKFGISIPSCNISGSGRRPIKELARRLGIPDVDRPGPICRLYDPGYMARLDDLLIHQADVTAADIDLLLLGRHYRLNGESKVIVGRNAQDNEAIAHWYKQHLRGRLFVPANFQCASALLIGQTENGAEIAMSLSAYRKSVPLTGVYQFYVEEEIVTLGSNVDIQTLKPIQAGERV